MTTTIKQRAAVICMMFAFGAYQGYAHDVRSAPKLPSLEVQCSYVTDQVITIANARDSGYTLEQVKAGLDAKVWSWAVQPLKEAADVVFSNTVDYGAHRNTIYQACLKG